MYKASSSHLSSNHNQSDMPAVISKPQVFKKKALLVGICYEETENEVTLRGGHEGVSVLKGLLIGKY